MSPSSPASCSEPSITSLRCFPRHVIDISPVESLYPASDTSSSSPKFNGLGVHRGACKEYADCLCSKPLKSVKFPPPPVLLVTRHIMRRVVYSLSCHIVKLGIKSHGHLSPWESVLSCHSVSVLSPSSVLSRTVMSRLWESVLQIISVFVLLSYVHVTFVCSVEFWIVLDFGFKRSIGREGLF
jgi:hypothetical protein